MTLLAVPEEPTYVELKPRITDPERPRLSASGISTFRSCARKWYFQYMVGLPTTAGYEAAVGTFIHNVFEDIFVLDPEERTTDLALKMVAERWEKFYSEMTEEMMEAGIMVPREEELKKFTWDRTYTLWSIETPAEVEVVSVEQKLDVDIEGVHFYGFIDRAEMEQADLILSDYKTGKMGSDSYLTDKLNQILLYGLAYKYQEGKQAARGRLIYLRDGIVEVEYTERSMEETLKFLLNNNNRIKKTIAGTVDEAKPKTGPLCEWCPFINLCPEGQAKFAERRAEGRSRADAPAYKILGLNPGE